MVNFEMNDRVLTLGSAGHVIPVVLLDAASRTHTRTLLRRAKTPGMEPPPYRTYNPTSSPAQQR